MPTPPVVVVGSFVQDLFFETPAFPRPGQSVVGKFRTAPGGKGFNQAVAAARSGAKTGFIGAVGRDVFGAGARAFLDAEGIAGHFLEKTGHATGTAVVVVNAAGQNQIVVALGANNAIEAGDIPVPWLTGAKIVVSQLEIFLPAAREALHLARSAGAVTILNPAPMRADWDPAMLAEADILVPNETEFAALVNLLPSFRRTDFGEHELATLLPAEFQALCRGMGPSLVLVTLGARGCFLSLPDRAIALPALPDVVAVDTTGAGDAFVGAFAAAYLEFRGDAARAARFANAAAALSVTRPGAAPSVARRPEIDAVLTTLNA
jgi:ribokinase